MKFPHRVIAATALAGLAFAAVAGIAPAAMSQQSSLQSLLGSWTCVAHSSDGKTYHETDVNTMYGKWLKSDSKYPAQNGDPAGTGQSFIGYDSMSKRWVIAGVDTAGEYFVNYSNSANMDGSTWHDGYPNMHGSAIVHMTSTQYVVDTKGPGAGGKTVTSHEVCTKR
jgi:hypothetical protein